MIKCYLLNCKSCGDRHMITEEKALEMADRHDNMIKCPNPKCSNFSYFPDAILITFKDEDELFNLMEVIYSLGKLGGIGNDDKGHNFDKIRKEVVICSNCKQEFYYMNSYAEIGGIDNNNSLCATCTGINHKLNMEYRAKYV